MHVLIAGAGGPLGKQLIDAFLHKDVQVTAMGYSKKEFAGLYHPHLTTMACDVTKPEQLMACAREWTWLCPALASHGCAIG